MLTSRRSFVVRTVTAVALLVGTAGPAFALSALQPAFPTLAAMFAMTETRSDTYPLGVRCAPLAELTVSDGPVSRWWQSGRGGRTPTHVVIHTTESPREIGGARNVANWLANTDYRASSHFVVDAEETLLTVDIEDTAWGVGGAPNVTSIQIEMVGEASNTREEWLGDAGSRQLCRAAALTAQLAALYGIPLRLVEAPGLLAGTPGVAGHFAFTKAYGISTHTDPGDGFPWDAFLAQAASYMAETNAVAPLDVDRFPDERPAGPVNSNDTRNDPLPELNELYKMMKELERTLEAESNRQLEALGISNN